MTRRLRHFACLPLIALALCWAGAAAAATVQQTFTLQPGWNAIHVEVEPEHPEIETVFAGVPVLSVWRFKPDAGGAQFIRDPAEGLENIEGWFGWFPQPRPEAFLSNLFLIDGGTSYLVRVDGGATHQVTLSGKPKFRAPRWQPDAFTLTGLPVTASNGPSFAEYFEASSAHTGQPVYRLAPNGQWQLVTSPASTVIEPGRAYWIRTEGNSSFQGPMQLVLDQGESLEFSAALDEIRVVLRNRSGAAGSFQIQRISNGAMPLQFRNEDPETQEVGWPDLQGTLVLDAPADKDVFLTLAAKRTAFNADRMEEVLAITDENGQRVLLGVGGNTKQPLLGARIAGGKAVTAVNGFAGLWVGDVLIDSVSQAQTGGTLPTPTNRPFKQRFLIHVNASGEARLLKDVIQMWEEGTMQPSAADPSLQEVDEPGRYVLITDKNLIGLYSGATNVDGASVGIRYSTVAYDFSAPTMAFVGNFGPGSEISASVVVASNLPTNPFLHKYHPDHDNLDANFLNPAAEAYEVVRNIRFGFVAEDPSGGAVPGWGDSLVGGTFSESITGLHKNPIFTSGQFRLRRVSAVPVLNQ
ncbi:MAG TPA: hypothetical protein PLB00_02210 [Pseudomonadota bacterium]|jgi:hypothetical protein|nr:hypothetical protein [Pseudomonadota bacterium]